MNDFTSDNIELSPWITYAHELRDARPAGTLLTNDAGGKPVQLDWYFADILSEKLRETKMSIASLAAEITAAEEASFLRKYPEAVSQEMFLRPCEPLLANGVEAVDWQKVEETIAATVKGFYRADMKSFGDVLKPFLNDLLLVVSIKDDQKERGWMIASITPALPYGHVKLITLIIDPTEHERGLEKLLIASILKLIPKTERIFTGIRPTNNRMRLLYESLGFVRDMNPVLDPAHKIHPEYFVVLTHDVASSEILHVL